MATERIGARFAGKVVVVTGAGGGFGKAIADAFASEGAAVVVADINVTNGERVCREIEAGGGRALFVETDVSQSAAMKNLMDRGAGVFGGLDILINNAGFTHAFGPMAELSEEDYDRVFATNTKSVYLSVVHGVPKLRERGGGVIVNTASIGAVAPRPNMTAYNATKGAVLTMTRGLAAELAPDIRVNAVNPVAADTDFMKPIYGTGQLPEKARKALTRGIPMGRLTEPADVANAVLFLASEEARFLTGVCLPVDGGRSIG